MAILNFFKFKTFQILQNVTETIYLYIYIQSQTEILIQGIDALLNQNPKYTATLTREIFKK